MKLSFIIPVYNTPKEILKRCINSVRNIHEKNMYECILIDDGSAYEIGDFLKKYVQHIPKFKYIRKENGGVSSARNLGIENSSGKYICFVDSDDMIRAEFFDEFIADEHDEDIIFSDLIFINGNKKNIWKVTNDDNITIRTILARMLVNGEINGPYCKCIKRSFIYKYKIRFEENMVTAEDRQFLLDILIEKPLLSYKNAVSYYYYRNEQSGINRLKKYTEQFYSNYMDVFIREQTCISRCNISLLEHEQLRRCSDEFYIKTIFNLTLEIVESGLRNKRIDSMIIESMNCVNVKDIDTKSKVRRWLLVNKEWGILKILSILRRRYMRFKGLI